MSMMRLDPVTAFDHAFRGRPTEMIEPDGRAARLAVDHWASAPDDDDTALFLDPCTEATLDVGCGPGRLVGALVQRGVPALGIDVSREAVRQTRERGAVALRRDVFATLPDEGRWHNALLADGNVGIGGDPVGLLRRLRDLVTPSGRVIVEVAPAGHGLVRERRRLRVDGRLSGSFPWAVVGLDAIEDVAAAAGLDVEHVHLSGARIAVTCAPRRR